MLPTPTLAAQALLPRSYRIPVETWSTNVIGTVTLLDALRDRSSLKAIVVVTSDKVYANDKRVRPFIEGDAFRGAPGQAGMGMGVGIDEARKQRTAVGVDDLFGLGSMLAAEDRRD